MITLGKGKLNISLGLVYRREPRPEWLARLRGVSGPLDQTIPTPYLHWEPGDSWGPVQRWLIYQTWPDDQVLPDLLRQCRGPHPRSKGAFSPSLGRWDGGPAPLITRSQWEIYRACGRYGRPYWVVQGLGGGHKYQLNKWESKLSVLCGGPRDTPNPGELPYAEPDERTWLALGKADRMRDNSKTLKYMYDHPTQFTEAELAEARRVAGEVLQWVGLQSAEHADELAWALKHESLIPRPQAGERVEELDEDVVTEILTADLMRQMT